MEKIKKTFGMKLALKILLTILTILFFGAGVLAVHKDKESGETVDRWTSPMIFGIVGFEIVYIIWNA